MKEPVDHVLRPRLPWRDSEGAITECGCDATKVKTLTREEFSARLKEMGPLRTAVLTCMTCSDTARRWADWAVDPRHALQREIEWETRGRWSHDDGRRRLFFELKAIEIVISAHRDEFEHEVAKLQGTAEWQVKKKEIQAAKVLKRSG